MRADAAPELSVVIPALNEEETLPEVLDDHKRVLRELGVSPEILVCDDGSTDGTAAILTDADARIAMRRRVTGQAATTLVRFANDLRRETRRQPRR